MSNHIRIRQVGRAISTLAVLGLLASTFGTTAEGGWRVRNGRVARRYYIQPTPRAYYAVPPARVVAPQYVAPPRYVQPPAYRPYYFSPPPIINGPPNIPMPIMM